MHRNLGSIRGQYRKAYVARSSENFKSGRNFVIRKTVSKVRQPLHKVLIQENFDYAV